MTASSTGFSGIVWVQRAKVRARTSKLRERGGGNGCESPPLQTLQLHLYKLTNIHQGFFSRESQRATGDEAVIH